MREMGTFIIRERNLVALKFPCDGGSPRADSYLLLLAWAVKVVVVGLGLCFAGGGRRGRGMFPA